MKNRNQKIIPNLWFDKNAEEAVKFYTSAFEDSQIHTVCNYTEAGKDVHHQEPGSVMTMVFELKGFKMVALNGGPHFKFNPSISLFVLFSSEEKLTEKWEILSQGGEIMMPLDKYEWSKKYGWFKDRFGLNWQFMFEEKRSTDDAIVPLFFFTGNMQGKAEEALKFYTSIFKNSSIQGIAKYGDENAFAKGMVKHEQFYLEHQTFMAMDSGKEGDFPFNEAFSLIVECKDQKEIDYYWDKLSEGGDPSAQQCGWLKDKFGVSWQVVPQGMDKLFNNPDKQKVNQSMEAMLKMKKIDIEKIKGPVKV